jgi:hypothetical protein
VSFERELLAEVRTPFWAVARAVRVDPASVPARARDLAVASRRVETILDDRREQGFADPALSLSIGVLRAAAISCASSGVGEKGAGALADAYRAYCAALELRWGAGRLR